MCVASYNNIRYTWAVTWDRDVVMRVASYNNIRYTWTVTWDRDVVMRVASYQQHQIHVDSYWDRDMVMHVASYNNIRYMWTVIIGKSSLHVDSYSGTSNKGPPEKGTTSQQRTQFWTPFPKQ